MTANLFLAAASFPNFGRTMTEPIDVAEFDPPPDIPQEFVDDGPVRLWGTRKGGGNRDEYADLAVGDRLLFYDEDAFIAAGRVGKKFNSPWVSRTFWGYAPMELLYSVEEYRDLDVLCATVGDALGAEVEFEPDGLCRVDDHLVDRLAEVYGSLDAFLDEYATAE